MTKFQLLHTTLQKDNLPEEQQAIIIAEVQKAAVLKLYSESIILFTDDQRKQIKNTKDEEKMIELVAQFYQQKTGNTPQQAITDLQEQFAEKFLQEYKISTQ